MWDKDSLDTDLDFLDADISSKHFVCLQDVLKASWRQVLKTPWRHLEYVLKACLQDIFKTYLQDVFKTFSRRIQRNNFPSSKMFSFKTSSRRFQDVLEDEKLLHWRRSQDVFKTCIEDQQMFAGIQYPWIHSVSFQMYYLLLQVQEILVIFKKFA